MSLIVEAKDLLNFDYYDTIFIESNQLRSKVLGKLCVLFIYVLYKLYFYTRIVMKKWILFNFQEF